MRTITLHDFDDPTKEVPVGCDSITGIEPYETGSSITLGNFGPNPTILHVQESETEVQKLWHPEQ